MIKEAKFHCEYTIFEKAISLIKEYYTVKGYKVENKRVKNDVAFLFCKDTLYRRIIGCVPIISGIWSYNDGEVNVKVDAKMTHGINQEVATFMDKIFDLGGLKIAFKVSNAITDPLFGKSFTEEFLLMSEGLLSMK